MKCDSPKTSTSTERENLNGEDKNSSVVVCVEELEGGLPQDKECRVA